MGEFELLARVRERLPPPAGGLILGSGDDAAVTVAEGATATSVDAMVDGVHFRREWMSEPQIGRRALAIALSDLAAMGAAPREAYAAVGVPEDLDEEGCLSLLDGMAALAAETGAALAGGDIVRSPVLFCAITVTGHAPSPRALVTRAGARPGDALAVTGRLGGAAAGLLVLQRPDLAEGLDAALVESLRNRQLQPVPRLAAGLALAGRARAMIDISDGLGSDARHLAEAGGVRLEIDAASLPLQPGVAAVAGAAGLDPVGLAVSGGEDYELLCALPPGRLREAREAAGEAGLTAIGEVREGSGVRVSAAGREFPAGGFDQLDRPERGSAAGS
ncbi:MAG: thiamine-phosphate kinase [Solirubrobacterales bacterium]